MTILLRALVVFVLVLTALSALRRVLAPSQTPPPASGRTSRRQRASGKLVRDPVCGTYVAAAQAIHATRNGDTSYFCSEECREKFLGATP